MCRKSFCLFVILVIKPIKLALTVNHVSGEQKNCQQYLQTDKIFIYNVDICILNQHFNAAERYIPNAQLQLKIRIH